jgi:uncharacterized protein YqgC (DUF456 family)
MHILSLTWGIMALLGMLVGILPLFGALNWLIIPFAGIGAAVSGVALSRSPAENKSMTMAGLVCCLVAMVVGAIRLVLGLGVL